MLRKALCLGALAMTVSILVQFAAFELIADHSENRISFSFVTMNDPGSKEVPTRRRINRSTEIDPRRSTAAATNSSPALYAYAFLIGAIHEDRLAYRGFLYNVLVATKMLRDQGSTTADVWLIAQLSYDSKLDNALPGEDQRLLSALNIHVRLLDKPKTMESFGSVVFDKFRILEMTQYRRVMFIDADVLPLTNLEYLFHLSDGPDELLRPNVIMASQGEPCNAGVFVLAPSDGDWDRVQRIIANQRRQTTNTSRGFDFQLGWGHDFGKEGDYWDAIEDKNINHWHFHAGHSDQGLLYYWVRYVKKDVSIVIGNVTQNWVAGDDGKAQIVKNISHTTLQKYCSDPAEWQFRCQGRHHEFPYMCISPYRDFCHFMGERKPWQIGVKTKFFHGHTTMLRYAAYRRWFKELDDLNSQLRMGLDIENWDDKYLPAMKESPLGYLAKFD